MIFNQQYILDRSIPEPNSGCWLWLKSVDPNGYGRTPKLAHRISYEVFIGEIPLGKQVHHKCFQPGCVNPEHLLAVTQSEHLRLEYAAGRRIATASLLTHCRRGHLLDGTEASTRTKSGRTRVCKQCRSAKRKRRHNEIMAIVRSHEATKNGEV